MTETRANGGDGLQCRADVGRAHTIDVPVDRHVAHHLRQVQRIHLVEPRRRRTRGIPEQGDAIDVHAVDTRIGHGRTAGLNRQLPGSQAGLAPGCRIADAYRRHTGSIRHLPERPPA